MSLTQQVYEAIVDEICCGTLTAGSHLVQEDLAQRLGVSRQPVQQAMALLQADGMVERFGLRGVQVTPLDPELMLHHYEIRAALDGLAARKAALRVRQEGHARSEIASSGEAVIKLGKSAVKSGDVGEQVRQDAAFHGLIYACSGNPLLARTAEPQRRFLQRAMAEVLRRASPPREIWQQHAAILAAILAGNPARAEALAVEHDLAAAKSLHAALILRSHTNRTLAEVGVDDCGQLKTRRSGVRGARP